MKSNKKIGVTGFEPATSRPPAVRSNQTEPYPDTFIIITDIFKKGIPYFHFNEILT